MTAATPSTLVANSSKHAIMSPTSFFRYWPTEWIGITALSHLYRSLCVKENIDTMEDVSTVIAHVECVALVVDLPLLFALVPFGGMRGGSFFPELQHGQKSWRNLCMRRLQ